MPNSAPLSICPHCSAEVSGYLFLTQDGHSFRSYWCREHGDVVPVDDEYGEREQGNLPDVQDDILDSINGRHRECQGSLPEQEMPGKA